MYAVVGVGLVYSLALLGWAASRGRRRPRHVVPWIVALVFLGLDVAAHIAMSVGTMLQSAGAGGWIAVGTAAIAGVLATAVLQPKLAGWGLVGSAALMPLLLLVVSVWPGVDAAELAPLPVMLAFWSTRAVIVGALLVASESWPVRHRDPGVDTHDVAPLVEAAAERDA